MRLGSKHMKYKSLNKIYYSSPNTYGKEYKIRFSFPYSIHLGLPIKQYHRNNEYEAFFCYTNELFLLIEQIHDAYIQFLSLLNLVPPVVLHQFSLLSILDEVKSTNDIEGVRSTRKEIREIMDGRTAQPNRLDSIVHKYSSLLHDTNINFSSCEDIRAFYDDFTHKEVSEENPNHKLDGKIFRKDPVEIESPTGKIIHQGLYPESKIISYLSRSLEILHDKTLPKLVRLCLFHYLFAYIHPFYDGNGRTDRFITSYFLGKWYHVIPSIRLSVFIKKNRPKYYKLFTIADSELNKADLTPFIIGFLEIIHGTVLDTISLLHRKKIQLDRYEQQISCLGIKDETLNNIYFILLQAALFYGRGIKISDLMKLTGKSRGTIQKRLDGMLQNHIIVTKVKKFKYYKLNLQIFRE